VIDRIVRRLKEVLVRFVEFLRLSGFPWWP
jgi:hypothetical protein